MIYKNSIHIAYQAYMCWFCVMLLLSTFLCLGVFLWLIPQTIIVRNGKSAFSNSTLRIPFLGKETAPKIVVDLSSVFIISSQKSVLTVYGVEK